MTHARVAAGVTTAALLLVAITSCANGGPDPAASGSPTPSSPTPTGATTTPPSETKIASEAASALLRKYYAVRNELRQDQTKPLARLKTVAIGTELAAQQNLFTKERKNGLHQTGETKIAKLQVQSVNLDNSDPKAGKVPTAQIDVCFDVSNVDIIEANGESVVSSDRPNTRWIRYSVANYDWGSDPGGAWRVASSQDIEQPPCAVS